MRRLLLNIRCKVATTVTNSEDVSRIEHIVQRLESTFEAEVSVWCNRHNWTEHGCPKKNSVNWKCFSDVAASQKPISIELAPYDHVLLIPFEIDYESFIAVALVETSEPELMLKLADNWVGAQLLLQQNQELTTVNEGFIQQVSEDLEELNFLREISTHLEVSEAVEG